MSDFLDYEDVIKELQDRVGKIDRDFDREEFLFNWLKEYIDSILRYY